MANLPAEVEAEIATSPRSRKTYLQALLGFDLPGLSRYRLAVFGLELAQEELKLAWRSYKRGWSTIPRASDWVAGTAFEPAGLSAVRGTPLPIVPPTPAAIRKAKGKPARKRKATAGRYAYERGVGRTAARLSLDTVPTEGLEVFVESKGERHTGRFFADGSMEFRGETYSRASTPAKLATGWKKANGWKVWSYERDGETYKLDTLRR